MVSLVYLDPITYHVEMTASTKLLPVYRAMLVNLDVKDPLEQLGARVSREKTISPKVVKAALDKMEHQVSEVNVD